jgi:hypothetical protein
MFKLESAPSFSRVELGTEEAKQTILLQQIAKGKKQVIFVSAVANYSNAEQVPYRTGLRTVCVLQIITTVLL